MNIAISETEEKTFSTWRNKMQYNAKLCYENIEQ